MILDVCSSFLFQIDHRYKYKAKKIKMKMKIAMNNATPTNGNARFLNSDNLFIRKTHFFIS